jgi:predicted oxidoreductase
MTTQQQLHQFPIALGCMGLTGTWNPTELDASHERKAIAAFEAAFEAGIVVYDHADIYGGGTCEEVFAKCLAAVPGSREKIIIATKGGIRSGHYNLSAEYLNECIERSLKRMKIEAIDLYQLHRPDPLTHPRETAGVLNAALKSGKIRAIGVSNYYPEQVRALQTFLDAPIVSNQISLSLYRLDPIYEGLDSGKGLPGDGVLDQCIANDITPMAYSPLGKGKVACDNTEEPDAIQTKLRELAEKYSATTLQVALAWLLLHPVGVLPVVGSANPEHIREAAAAGKVTLSREDWYALWVAAWGRNIP